MKVRSGNLENWLILNHVEQNLHCCVIRLLFVIPTWKVHVIILYSAKSVAGSLFLSCPVIPVILNFLALEKNSYLLVLIYFKLQTKSCSPLVSWLACVASTGGSVRFGSKERGTRDKDRAKKWGEQKSGESFHFSRGQTRKSRSSSFLFCLETTRKRLLRKLSLGFQSRWLLLHVVGFVFL